MYVRMRIHTYVNNIYCVLLHLATSQLHNFCRYSKEEIGHSCCRKFHSALPHKICPISNTILMVFMPNFNATNAITYTNMMSYIHMNFVHKYVRT